jgi:hypothetical protein
MSFAPGFRHPLPLAAILVLLVGGCQLTRDFSRVELAEEKCEIGATVECGCGGGTQGVQTCVDGGVYEPCRCSADGGSDLDAPDGSDVANRAGDLGDSSPAMDVDAGMDGTDDEIPDADADGSAPPTDTGG